MKSTIITALFSLSLHVAGYAETAPAADHPGFESPPATSESRHTSVPEAGAAILGLVGAILLLRRRRS